MGWGPVFSLSAANSYSKYALSVVLTKLDERSKEALIRHVERNPYDNLKALGTSSKSGNTLSRPAIRRYLKAEGCLRFKKPFLSNKHKAARLK